MSADVPVRRSPHFIRPDHRRTVVRTFMPGDSPSAIEAEQTRAQRIIARVHSLPEDDLSVEYSRLPTVLCGRHRELEKVFLQRYENARELLGGGFSSSGTRAKLIGAYFSEEYSYQSAALFNPSIVMHPEQSGCAPGLCDSFCRYAQFAKDTSPRLRSEPAAGVRAATLSSTPRAGERDAPDRVPGDGGRRRAPPLRR